MPVSCGAAKAFSVALLILSMAVVAAAQNIAGSHTQVADKRLMTDADYKTFLLQVETAAPKWVTMISNITPERIRRTSYAQGLSFYDIGQIRAAIAEQRVKRTLSGELALLASMRSLWEMGKVLSKEQAVMSGYTDSSFDNFAPELGELYGRIGNDVNARVALLEKGICP
jgi:hypothetical protein